MNPPTARTGFLVGADLVNTQDAALAPVKWMDMEMDGNARKKLNEITSVRYEKNIKWFTTISNKKKKIKYIIFTIKNQ